MAFDIMRLFEDEGYISPGTIGGKIKRYRELRGWSQKELGIKCGFSASTADVRIAQYEKNKKIPREKALKDIAAALGIDECALFDADMLPYNRMYHALFDMEDFHGLHPVKKPDGYYLEFSGGTVLDQTVTRRDFEDFLAKWYEMRQKYQANSSDSAEDKANKIKEYTLWRGEYPYNVARETSEKMRDTMRMNHLQAEMDALNAKMKNDEELAKLDKALESVMSEVRFSYKPVCKESDLIYLIKDMLEKGVKIVRYTPEERLEPNYDEDHLLSVRTAEILGDEEKKRLFAGIVCAIETIQQCGINISRKITSRNNELFVTYIYPSSQHRYFDNLWKHWDDMTYIVERKVHLTDQEVEDFEKKFKENIAGKDDMIFSDKKLD